MAEPKEQTPKARRNSAMSAIAAFVAPASLGSVFDSLSGTRRRSSYAERHSPAREKTPEDMERIEAARRKRERKKARKAANRCK